MKAWFEKTPASVWRNPWHFLAFGCGSGALPKVPGTWGTLAALLFMPVLQLLPVWAYILFVFGAFLFGCWLCGKVARELGVHDHGGIVWDEWVGLWISLFLVPSAYWWLGFVLFRALDMLKPWPISWLDRHVHGGFGIMLDDIVAGLVALVGVQLLLGWL